MRPTVQELYDGEVRRHKMFIECGYTKYKDKEPTLPSHAIPGCYPLYYIDGNNCVLCSQCATEALLDNGEFDDWKPQLWDIHYEGDDIQCESCYVVIESAYGNPESEVTE